MMTRSKVVTGQQQQEESARSQALREARMARMTEWFGKRSWRVCTELTSDTTEITVRKGEFWIKGGKVFKTPFGNRGTHGYILQEVDRKTGADVWKKGGKEPSRASFGWITISHAADMFPGSIVEVPPRPYGQRGGVASALERNAELLILGGETDHAG
jgi:hypothetical protein